MASAKFKSVDDYIAAQPNGVQRVLTNVRNVIRKAVPDADEAIAYFMPTYRLHGRILLSFAAWKQHYALYLATKPLVRAFAEELAPYEIIKGTIRFPLDEPVPRTLIARIAKFRAQALA